MLEGCYLAVEGQKCIWIKGGVCFSDPTRKMFGIKP